METECTTRFHGASKEGIAHIETWILESRESASDLLRSEAAKRNETLCYIAASSGAAFEQQWKLFEATIALSVHRSRENVIYSGAAILIATVILWGITTVAQGSANRIVGDLTQLVALFGTAAAIAATVFVWRPMLKGFLRSRRLGYADLFTRNNKLGLKVWGVCPAAIYVTEIDDFSGACGSRRISKYEIATFEQDVTPLGPRITFIEENGQRHDLYEPCYSDKSLNEIGTFLGYREGAQRHICA